MVNSVGHAPRRAVRSRLWLIPAGVSWVWAIVIAFPGRTFLGSDDALIASIVQGTYSGSPEPRAVFLSVALTKGISGLSQLWPSVGWYSVAIWTALGLGTGLIWLFGQRLYSGIAFSPLATLVGVVAVPLALRVSFTTTAFLLGGAAVLGLIAVARAPREDRVVLVALASLAFAVALMLRFNAASAALVAGFPAVVYAAWRCRRHSLVVLGIFATLALSLMGLDSVAYSSDEWSRFRQWTAARSELIDYRLSNLEAVRVAAGWSENDWTVFRGHRYFDENVFGLEAVTAAADAAVRVRAHIDYVSMINRSPLWATSSLLVLLAGFGIFLVTKDALALTAGITVIWTWAVAAAILWFRFRLRVFDGIMVVGLLAAIGLLLIGLVDRGRPYSTRTLSIAGMILLAAGMWQADNRGIVYARSSLANSSQETIAPFVDLSKTNRLMGEALALSRNWDPLYSTDVWAQVKFISPSWYAFSPPWLARLSDLGMEDAPVSLLDDDVLYLTRRGETTRPTHLSAYLREHHDVNAVACRVEVPGVDQPIWRFVKREVGCEDD